MKREGIHLSKWVMCEICKEEFRARSATICKECLRQKKYEEWVKEGNKPVEI
jgi:hypothetical protein